MPSGILWLYVQSLVDKFTSQAQTRGSFVIGTCAGQDRERQAAPGEKTAFSMVVHGLPACPSFLVSRCESERQDEVRSQEKTCILNVARMQAAVQELERSSFVSSDREGGLIASLLALALAPSSLCSRLHLALHRLCVCERLLLHLRKFDSRHSSTSTGDISKDARQLREVIAVLKRRRLLMLRA